MEFKNRISPAQDKFMRTLRDGTLTLGELKKLWRIKEGQYERWLRNPYFRVEQGRVLRNCERRRFVELDAAANVAAELLCLQLRGKVQLTVREIYLCKTIVELATVARESRRRSVRRRKSGEAIPKEKQLCHPSVRDQRGELLRGLKAAK